MATTQDNPALERIEQEINDHPIVLFMKGTPIFPQCGFSAMVVQVLTQMGAKFKSIDVLNEPPIRDGIKQYSDWPTIPQKKCQMYLATKSHPMRQFFLSTKRR